jgi:hypothetical protein
MDEVTIKQMLVEWKQAREKTDYLEIQIISASLDKGPDFWNEVMSILYPDEE